MQLLDAITPHALGGNKLDDKIGGSIEAHRLDPFAMFLCDEEEIGYTRRAIGTSAHFKWGHQQNSGIEKIHEQADDLQQPP